MMNVLAAHFMAQTRDQFYVFQVVFTFLNLLMFLPCCLILPALLKTRQLHRRPAGMRVLALAALFAMNPVVMENCTYSWSKGLPAFYVILAISLYLAAWRKNERRRMTAAFVSMAAGLLAHYSVGPYCAFLALHYVFFLFWRRRRKWPELAGIVAASGALLATWFGWSVAVYGPAATFESNTSVTSAARYTGGNWGKILGNLLDSAVPNIVRDPASIHQFDQANPSGFVRDNAFRFYQVNAIFGMGLIGGPLALWLLYRGLRRGERKGKLPHGAREFWGLMVPFCLVVGIAVVGERNYSGSAHLTLIAAEVLGLTLIAAAFPLRRAAAIALLAGCAVDFSLGVFLQARIESLENTPGQTVFTVAIGEADGQPGPGPQTPESLTFMAGANWFAKHQYELSNQWARAYAAERPADAALEPARAHVLSFAQSTLRQDADLWHGWGAQHDYQFLFLGDLAAGLFGERLNGLAALWILLFAGLMGVFARQALRPASTPTAGTARRPPKQRKAARKGR